MKPLLVLGSSNIDHIAQMAAFPKSGETLHGDHYHRAYGGKGANQAVAAAKSGAPTRFISAFGNDTAGGELRAHLEALGIDCDGSKTVADSTGMAIIWLNHAGENRIVVIAGANAALNAAHVEHEQARIADAGILLLQLETPLDGVIRAAAIARAHSVRTILNPAPATELPRELLANLDLITPNESEAERLTGIAVADEMSAARAATALHAQGVPTVLITLGSRRLCERQWPRRAASRLPRQAGQYHRRGRHLQRRACCRPVARRTAGAGHRLGTGRRRAFRTKTRRATLHPGQRRHCRLLTTALLTFP